MADLKAGDHVRIREWDEGVGIVRKVGEDGGVWVETGCNMYRNYPADMFAKTSEPLSPAVES